MKNLAFETQVVHAAQQPDELTGSLNTPIYQTATYSLKSLLENGMTAENIAKTYTYSRTSNPTNDILQEKIATLAGAQDCVVTSSGLGAISSIFATFLRPGDHILVADVIYGSTQTLIDDYYKQMGIQVDYVNTSNLDLVKKAIKMNTKIIYTESPANPNMKITDIAACAKIAHEYNAILVVDSTFSPFPIQFPNKLGADICVYSTTKYINGHGNALGGAITGKSDLIKEIKNKGVKIYCATPASPFNSWLTLNGIRTIDLRMKKHSEVALEVAKFLETSPYVEKVFYPGLESFEGHEIAKKQMNGLYGGMLAFEIKDGINGMTKLEFCQNLLLCFDLITVAASLGEMESLIEHPALMTHRALSTEDRLKVGITDGLLRTSIGIENPKDLIADFTAAFEKAKNM